MTFLVESGQTSNSTLLYRFYRDKKNDKKMEVIRNFLPYFFVLEEENIPEDNRLTAVEGGYKGILGEKLKKIYVRKSSDVPEVRDKFSKHWEADILFPNRYIIDKIGEIEPYPLKILYLDIELNSDDRLPDMENPNQEVTCISMMDSFENKVIKLILEHPNWSEETSKELIKNNCIILKTEEELLGTFVSTFVNYDPDLISGWNVEAFDLTYLIRRMEKLEIDYRKLSPLRSVRIDEKFGDVRIKGRIVSDMMKNYMHFRNISNQGKASSYSLEFTSQELLGEGKIEHTETFSKMWKNNPVNLINYNEKDVNLVKQINDKFQIIEFLNQLRCISCAQLNDVYNTSRLIDGLLLKKLNNKLVLPSKVKNQEDVYEGAYVIPPKAGIYENILAVDVKGLYPNIIKSLNIGYETFNPDGEIQIEKGIGFNKGIGIMSQTIRDLEKKRNYFKKLKKESKTKNERQTNDFKQYAIKVLMNALYGYLGCPYTRLYKREIAGAITTIGRKVIKWSKSVVENLGYDVIYGDTDAIYIKSKETNLVNILKEGKKLITIINNSYKNFIKEFGSEECTLEMEFEKIFKKIMFVSKRGETKGAKKKYAYRLLWANGENVDDKIRFVGFAVRRSDSCKIARDIQENVITMILDGKPKEEVIEYLKNLEKRIRNKEISDEEIGFPKEIKENLGRYGRIKKKEDGTFYKTGVPPVVSGSRYSNKYLGTRFEKGSKPKFIYIKTVPLGFPNTRVISFDTKIPEGFIPDYDKINERIFKFKLEATFKSAGFGEFPEINSSIQTMDKWI